ncbi:MAG TPA: c(7)-type cytochrome triheme domain-containing protein [Candidatus Polarisedimenticolia bacterium]|nr:c(7)-type cytochrome triheme domain-containing protein [Candidatus Polarisedimenticolia bacterium]
MHPAWRSAAARIARRVVDRAGPIALLVLLGALLPAPAPRADASANGSPAASAPVVPPALRLPPDIVFNKAVGSPGPVVFRHTTHVELAGTRCVGCHPQPFRMLRPTRRVTHDDMNAGRSCGVCHDGRTATGTQDGEACGSCHAAAGGTR